jgi:hypothetical protein
MGTINNLKTSFNDLSVSMPSDGGDKAITQSQGDAVLKRANQLREEFNIDTQSESNIGSSGLDDVVNQSTIHETISTGSGKDIVNSSGLHTTIRTGGKTDIINDSGYNTKISSGSGDDVIKSSGANAEIRTGIGNDVILGTGLNANIRSGSGDDLIVIESPQLSYIQGGLGPLPKNTSNINAGSGNDTIILNQLSANNETLNIKGGSGNDTLVLAGNENEFDMVTTEAGAKVYTHRTTNTKINVAKDVENIEFKPVTAEDLSKTNFQENFEDYNNTYNQLTELISSGNTAEADKLQKQLDDKGDNLLNNTESITMSYDDFVLDSGVDKDSTITTNPVLQAARLEFFKLLESDISKDLEAQLSEALRIDTDEGRVSAAALEEELGNSDKLTEVTNDSSDLVGQLVDKVQIDFGDINQDQAKFLYEMNLDNTADFENQQSEALALDTDAGRSNSASLNIEIKITKHVVKELERQFGFNKEEVFPERYEQSKFFIDLNNKVLSDLEGQMSEAVNVDTDAGRVSAAALRTEIGVTKNLLKFWTETANFWKPD